MASPAALSFSHQSLVARLAEARAQTDELFRIVKPEAMHDRPVPERHRVIFYLGHLEAFDWNLLGRNLFDLPSVSTSFDKLFAFGIDPVDGGLPSDQPSDWPARGEIEQYNARVRAKLDARIQTTSFHDPAVPLLRNGFLLHVAIEHRLMHAETLAYMLHQLSLDRKLPPASLQIPPAALSNPEDPVARMVQIPAGRATLGRPRAADGAHDGEAFGWDNEFEEHAVEVPAFAIDLFKVTNGQFLRFLEEGGYLHRALWNGADWAWRESQSVEHPLFWRRAGNRWLCRTMFAEIPLPLDWPVYVSHAEASAYARWTGKALPTEAQWHRSAYGTREGTERAYPWGSEAPEARHGNFDFRGWEPTPVNAHPAGASAFGVNDLVGNGWEWTRTIFGPLPGFQPFPFYRGYSANFFDGKHYVMKGGSARTGACMLRRSFRNWFQPHYPYVYAGFRCVEE